jgi:hypothetical protein
MEEKRELIYSLLRVLGGVMEVVKNEKVTQWIWSEELQKVIRIK